MSLAVSKLSMIASRQSDFRGDASFTRSPVGDLWTYSQLPLQNEYKTPTYHSTSNNQPLSGFVPMDALEGLRPPREQFGFTTHSWRDFAISQPFRWGQGGGGWGEMVHSFMAFVLRQKNQKNQRIQFVSPSCNVHLDDPLKKKWLFAVGWGLAPMGS